MTIKTRIRLAAGIIAAVLASPVFAGNESLALRINNAAALAGGVGAFTIRTYSSRPVNQGQVCIRVKQRLRGLGGNPIASISQVTVFGHNDDPAETIFLDNDGADQIIMLQFSSETSSINAVDGPLAAVFFNVESTAPAGARYDLELDLANTMLIDANGSTIPLELRNGRLDIRGPGEALSLAAAAEPTFAGGVAFTSVQTNEPFAISAGLVGFRYNTRMFPARPKVSIDSRYGNGEHNIIFLHDGLLLLSFSSADNTMNTVPGDILAIKFISNPFVQAGVESLIWLDPVHTFLWDENGASIPIELDDDVVRFR